MAKLTIWYILKKKECTGCFIKGTKDHRRLTSFLGYEKPQYHIYGKKWKVFSTRCKSLVRLKNRKVRLDFIKKTSKKKKKILDRGNQSFTRMTGTIKWRRKGATSDPDHITLFARHGGGIYTYDFWSVQGYTLCLN